MSKKRVLVFPAGTEISFEIHNALINSKFIELVGGTSIRDHSEMVYSEMIYDFPYIDDENFLNYLNKIIKEYKIDYVYPAHDSVVLELAKKRNYINAKVVATDYETVDICRFKNKTYEFFHGENFIPEVFTVEKIPSYPVFIKPKVGQGAVGARLINNKNEMDMYFDDSYVICEYLSGPEITVDCYTNTKGELKAVFPRTRERIRNGISVRSKNIELTNELLDIAKTINLKMKFLGAWFFQIKKNSQGKYKLLEISPRIPGTMGLSRNRGVNFPMLSIYAIDGIDCEVNVNSYSIMVERALISRYKLDISYKNVYIDLDDTLIVDNNVNAQLMLFIYQCVNKGKYLYLLTKHEKVVKDTLSEHRISNDLFEEIILINKDDEKYKYIKSNSIFIDDSFAERKKVKDKNNIPVFSVDMIESLIDWRY